MIPTEITALRNSRDVALQYRILALLNQREEQLSIQMMGLRLFPMLPVDEIPVARLQCAVRSLKHDGLIHRAKPLFKVYKISRAGRSVMAYLNALAHLEKSGLRAHGATECVA